MMFSRINRRNRLWASVAVLAMAVSVIAGNSSAVFAGRATSVASEYNHARAAQRPGAVESLVNVTPSNPNGWAFSQDPPDPAGTGNWVAGPGTPPIGPGSASLSVANSSQRELFGTLAYNGTYLRDLMVLSYSNYSVGSSSQAVYINIGVDFDLTDANNSFQGRLTYSPGGVNGAIVADTWQNWNALTGRWFLSALPAASYCGQNNPCTIAQLQAPGPGYPGYPNMGIMLPGPAYGFFAFKAGGNGTAFTGSVDNFHIATSALAASNTTYNFDTDPVVNAYGHLDPQAASGPGYEAYATQAWALVNTRLNLDMKVNSGSANNKLTVAQNYLGLDSSRLKNVDASSNSCTPTSTVTRDATTFDFELQNEVCNGPANCTFGQNTVSPGSMAFASGTSGSSGTSGDFRVAQVGLCTTSTLGDAAITWQNDAANNRDSYMEDELFNRISNFSLYQGYTVHVVAPQLVGHVKWQGVPEPDARSAQPITLTVKSGAGSEQSFSATTDASGFFTVTLGAPVDGTTYSWRAKGPKALANTGSFLFSSSNVFTRVEMNNVYNNSYTDCNSGTGCMRGGDANNDNRVNASDYNIFRATFNTNNDPRADFNNDGLVDISDFNILRSNFGVAGAPPITPGGGQPK